MNNIQGSDPKKQQVEELHKKQQIPVPPEIVNQVQIQKTDSIIIPPQIVTQHNGEQKIESKAGIIKPQTNKLQTIQSRIEQYLLDHEIQMTEIQIQQFIDQQKQLNRPFQPKNLQQWLKDKKKQEKMPEKVVESQNKQSEKQKQINSNQGKLQEKQQKIQKKQKLQQLKQKNLHEKQNKSQLKQTNENDKQKKQHKKQSSEKQLEVQTKIQKQLNEQDIIIQFFAQKQPKEIKGRVMNAFNSKLQTKIPLTQDIILKYMKQNQENRSLQYFKEWYSKEQKVQLSSLLQNFNQSENAKQIRKHIKKMQQIVSMATDIKKNLNVHFNAGQTKGKTAVKFGLELKQPAKTKFSIIIEIKIKKKSELKQYIQNLIKKKLKLTEYNFWKLVKIHFTELQKSLKIQIQSKFFEEFILNDFILNIEKRFSQTQKPVLKLEGDISIKNSIRLDENNFQNKRFVKWVGQGFSKTLKVQANSKLIQYFTKPFAEFFPIFKVIKSGEISLKLKQVQNIDKLFDRLGISEICEQTPSLKDYISVVLKQHLDSTVVLWVGDILLKSLIFSCTIPNERISFQVDINISHLNINLSLGSQACKQLGDLLTKITKEQFD